MTDYLHQEPERDQFKSESPIRAFTNWTVQGRYALGKGFRPSLAHVIPYLNAMEAKEGWQVVQVLEADTQTPSFLFRQSYVVPDDVLIERLRGDDGFKQQVRDWLNGEEPYDDPRLPGFEEAGEKMDAMRKRAEADFSDDVDPASRDPLPSAGAIGDDSVDITYQTYPLNIAEHPAFKDDPVNPKHYGGTACAEIGELLSANSYQVLKYNWRLGEKDSPCVEIGKSIWYLERELALIAEGNTFLPGDDRLPDHTFFDARLKDRSGHTINVARALISWNRYGNPETLKLLRRVLGSTLDSYNGCNDWGNGLAI